MHGFLAAAVSIMPRSCDRRHIKPRGETGLVISNINLVIFYRDTCLIDWQPVGWPKILWISHAG
jgi:hypothetical protein